MGAPIAGAKSGSRASASSLSGGNQQRLVVARELHGRPALVVAENPTRGLDVAGTRFVHDALRRLRASDDAPATVLISTDLDEVLALSDRIYTLVRGKLVAVPTAECTREGVGARMLDAVGAGTGASPSGDEVDLLPESSE